MTREQIIAGLDLVIFHLANDGAPVPDGWSPHEWSYVRGLASAELFGLVARLRKYPALEAK